MDRSGHHGLAPCLVRKVAWKEFAVGAKTASPALELIADLEGATESADRQLGAQRGVRVRPHDRDIGHTPRR